MMITKLLPTDRWTRLLLAPALVEQSAAWRQVDRRGDAVLFALQQRSLRISSAANAE